MKGAAENTLVGGCPKYGSLAVLWASSDLSYNLLMICGDLSPLFTCPLGTLLTSEKVVRKVSKGAGLLYHVDEWEISPSSHFNNILYNIVDFPMRRKVCDQLYTQKALLSHLCPLPDGAFRAAFLNKIPSFHTPPAIDRLKIKTHLWLHCW